MLNSAQNTDICIWFDLCCSASGSVYCTRCSTCVSRFLRVSPWSTFGKAFSEQNERSLPWGVCFLLCVHLPVINDCSASLADTATTKTPERQAAKKKEKEKTKDNMLYKWARAGTGVRADCIGEFVGGKVGCVREKATEKRTRLETRLD